MTTADPDTPPPAHGLFSPKGELIASIVAGVLLLAGFVAAQSFGRETTLGLIGTGAVWASLGIGMIFGVKAAWEALRDLSIDIDVLMVVGAALSAVIGHPAEGALLMFLFTLSGALEELAMMRTQREIESLHKMMPTEALLKRGDAIEPIDPTLLQTGDVIRIRPGDLVAADARITLGRSAVDQSTLTGESLPREVGEGDEIFAGTVNLGDALDAQVIRPAAESGLQKILKLVTEAREQREPAQRMIDRLSGPYAKAVMSLAAIVMLVWWLVFGEPFASAALTAITFLVVLSPCALIIATPTCTLSTIGRGARAGVLFKGGQAVERLSRAGALCLDKTGMLTMGKPAVVAIESVGWSDADELLAVAAALEEDSTHPLARAIIDEAMRRGLSEPSVSDVRHEAGRGISGRWNDDTVRLGMFRYAQDAVPVCLRARVREIMDAAQERGQIGVVVARGGTESGEAAVVIISDPPRFGARALAPALARLGISPVRMLTGDSEKAAARVASELAIPEWHAELLPEQKVEHVRALKDRAHKESIGGVAFIGDGVNDAAALAAADVSIAMGTIGSDAALESADIVLLGEDLAAVPWAIRLARRSRAILRFNLALALAVIAGMGIWVLIGSRIKMDVPLWVGVIAHEGGTLFVVANSLRLLAARGFAPSTDRPASGEASAEPSELLKAPQAV
ncbi:MAG: cation-translocating P-type ATPase [Phycisphaerales bacterium]